MVSKHLKIAQTFGLRRARIFVIGISKEDCILNVVMYGSNLLVAVNLEVIKNY
jgi:hypothetical protein